MRLSSPTMAAALIEGATEAGADVLDIGLVGTEMVYFAVGSLGPRRRRDGHRLAQPEGVHGDEDRPRGRAARRRRLGPSRRARSSHCRDRPRGTVPVGHVRSTTSGLRTSDRVLSFVDVGAIRPLKVVIDAANGMAGAMLPPVLERLPIEAVRCYFEPDGSFPNHEPNPLLPENREFIVRKTLEEGADLGVAFDGDADRCFFVDDTGEFVPGDFATALFAQGVLEKEPGAKVIYDLRASWAVPETVEAAGGVGRSSTASAMPSSRSGCARSTPRSPARSRATTTSASSRRPTRASSRSCVMLERISKGGTKLSELLRPFRERYFITGELNTPVADVPAKLARARGALRAGGNRLPPRRPLGRGGGLALQRAALEHRAAAPPEPRGALRGADGAQARRGARGDPCLRPPFKFSATTRVGFSDTDAQGGRLLRPLHAVLRPRPGRVPPEPRHAPRRAAGARSS